MKIATNVNGRSLLDNCLWSPKSRWQRSREWLLTLVDIFTIIVCMLFILHPYYLIIFFYFTLVFVLLSVCTCTLLVSVSKHSLLVFKKVTFLCKFSNVPSLLIDKLDVVSLTESSFIKNQAKLYKYISRDFEVASYFVVCPE